MVTEETGRFLIGFCRQALELYLRHRRVIDFPRVLSPELKEKHGVYVKLYKKIGLEKQLRGSKGIPFPTDSLIKTSIDAVISSSQDKTYPQLELQDMPMLTIELSILTEPALLLAKEPHDYLKQIRIATDGLIMQHKSLGGIFLPYTPIQNKWTTEEFLENLAKKVNLPPEGWKTNPIKLYRFQSQTFRG